ncbi:AlpA family phage regulatory protein [Ectothiorhodospiraceae bacterium BW-2]|nr:AlpA family phage regulatory protein [Ectothiorhodospiraceae bacterium BW-2]
MRTGNYPTLKEKLHGQQFVRIGQFCKLSTLSRSTVWRKIKRGELPPLVKLSTQTKAFRVVDILDWFDRIEEGLK